MLFSLPDELERGLWMGGSGPGTEFAVGADAVAEASAAEMFAGAAVDLLLREMGPPVGRPNMSCTIRAPETSSSGANRGICCRAVCGNEVGKNARGPVKKGC